MSKSVNVDFVTRQIEVDTDGKEHFISAAMAAKDAEQSMISAQNAANLAEVQANSVKKYKALWFDSVAAMKAEPSLTAGAYVNTAGYYEPNDGGSASYLIRAKADADVDDAGSLHELSNRLVAELIIENGTVNVKQFGAKGDGVTDDSTFIYNAIVCSLTKVDSDANHPKVYFPYGIFVIEKNCLFSDFDFETLGLSNNIKESIIFLGDGETSSVLKLKTQKSDGSFAQKWFYDNKSIDTEKFKFLKFYNLGFSTDNTLYGNGFKQWSQGGEKQFRFAFCRINLGTVLQTEGTGNADLNRFLMCVITSRDYAFVLNNPQSVANELISCDVDMYKGLVYVKTGGDFRIIGGNYEMHQYDETENVENAEQHFLIMFDDNLKTGPSNSHFEFSSIRFEILGNNKGIVYKHEKNNPARIIFEKCDFATWSGVERNAVDIVTETYVKFANTSLNDGMLFLATNPSSYYSASVGATIEFESCAIGRQTNLWEKCTANGYASRIIANGCYRIGIGAGSAICCDFDYGNKNGNARLIAGTKKYAILDISYPFVNDGSYDAILTIPQNVYITKIFIYKPTSATSNDTYQLHVGSYDKTTILGSSVEAPHSAVHEIELNNVGKLTFNKIRVWATGQANVYLNAQNNGISYIEYI